MRASDLRHVVIPLAALSLGAAIVAAAQPTPFNAFLLPAASAIDVGDTAFVRFAVDSTARQFNAYEITILYRPDIVDFLPPVVEGPLMHDACGNTFQHLAQTESTLTYAHSLLCAGISLDGPGLLSTYAFKGLANGVSPITITTDPNRAFFDAGIFVSPNHPTFPRQVFLHNAQITVGPSAGVRRGEAPPPAFRLEQNVPNPFRTATAIAFELGDAGPATLEVFDPAGRRVWAAAAAFLGARHRVPWYGAALDGAPLPSGAYIYRLTTPEGSESRKLTLLR